VPFDPTCRSADLGTPRCAPRQIYGDVSSPEERAFAERMWASKPKLAKTVKHFG
jgi:hypothetical protein